MSHHSLNAVLFLFVTLSALASEPVTTRYFGATPFRESPFPRLSGIHPLSAREAGMRNHFRFEYDIHGRPTRISFQLGDQVRNTADTANLFIQAPITMISYQGNIETRSFADQYGNLITVRGNVFREIYTSNQAGFPTSLHFLDINGNQIENAWNIYRYSWKILADGTVEEQRFNAAGEPAPLRPGFFFYTIRLHYGQDSHLALMQYVDGQGRLKANETGAAQDKLEFNVSGDMTAWNVLDTLGGIIRGNGPNVARGHRRFDRFGNETRHWFTDEKGERIPTAYGFWASNTQFDRFGNMIGRTFTDSQDRKSPHQHAGYVSLKVTWDRSGLERRNLQYLDADNKPTMHRSRGYAAVNGQFDQAHNLLETRFLDTTGKPINRLDSGVAFIRHSYDDKNRRTRTIYLDQNQNPVTDRRRGHASITRAYRQDGAPLGPRYFDQNGQEIKEDEAIQ